jgi:hypothetical protein
MKQPSIGNPGVMHNRELTTFINKEAYEKLKKDYAYAVAEGFDSFIFMDREMLTSYAKYLVEYLTAYFEQQQ